MNVASSPRGTTKLLCARAEPTVLSRMSHENTVLFFPMEVSFSRRYVEYHPGQPPPVIRIFLTWESSIRIEPPARGAKRVGLRNGHLDNLLLEIRNEPPCVGMSGAPPRSHLVFALFRDRPVVAVHERGLAHRLDEIGGAQRPAC